MDLRLHHFIAARQAASATGDSPAMPTPRPSATRHRPFLTACTASVMLAMLMPLAAQAETPVSINMKMLIVSANGAEPSLSAIKATLDHVGIPYDTLIATQTPLTAQTLSDGAGHGRYQGILLTTGSLGYQNPSNGNYESALTQSQWELLQNYEATFKVRQATLYTYPEGAPSTYGLNLVTGTGSPVAGTLTSAGKQVFSYLNPNSTINFKNTWTYLAMPATASNPQTLVTTPQGYALASIYTFPDGRQNLAITADSNPYLIHALQLGYGIVNWVSKGVFLGERRVYLNAQVDDVMIADDMWDPDEHTDQSGLTFRMSGTDLQRLVGWQNRLNASHQNFSQIRLEMGFNGKGAGDPATDNLIAAIKAYPNAFKWISHTYSHASLDDISYGDALNELQLNHDVAVRLGLQRYFKDSLIQPDVSGLGNSDFLLAAKDFGLRYILSDTSVSGGGNPSPNIGMYSPYQPSILTIPRHPTNLYYNVSTPEEWVSEYNYFYGPGGLYPAWDHELTYAEILDKESDLMLQDLLRYDMDSLMFHQPNLRAYDGTNSLLGDLINATLNKYKAVLTLPIISPGQHDTGILMANRMKYNASGVTGVLTLGPTNSITLKTVKSAVIPLTGISYGADKTTYGGQAVSRFSMGNNSTVTIPGPAW